MCFITEPLPDVMAPVPEKKVAIYARVSASKNKDNLETQTKRLRDYCAAKGLKVSAIVKEIGSGVNDTRPKLMKLITDPTISIIVVEHKERLTRFGFNYIEKLLAMQGRQIEGTYRGTVPVTHYFNPATGLNVIVDANNDFVGGWRLSPTQIQHLLTSGNVQ